MTTSAGRIPRLTDIIGRWFASGTPAKTDHSVERSGSTTTGGGSGSGPVVVWTAAYPLEARIVKGRLEAAGIPAAIQGEAVSEIFGLSSGGLAETDVLVPAPLAEKALALLDTEFPASEIEEEK